MTTSSSAEQPSRAGRGAAARWVVRVAAMLGVVLLLDAVVVYVYPWLEYYGVVG